MKEASANWARGSQVSFSVLTATHHTLVRLTFEHTPHSLLRAHQRGLSQGKISVALQYGTPINKQGLLFYVLGEKDIPRKFLKQKDKLRNTVVVVAGDSNHIITSYRSKSPYKNIKVKPKRLLS